MCLLGSILDCNAFTFRIDTKLAFLQNSPSHGATFTYKPTSEPLISSSDGGLPKLQLHFQEGASPYLTLLILGSKMIVIQVDNDPLRSW